MSDVSIRDADARDFTAIVRLNDAEVSHTSPMDEARLAQLHALACHHRVADIGGRVAAFLLAMQPGCGYRNDNFEWFSPRFDSFLYVDRIVVDARDRGSRLGTLLYEDLFEHARRIGIRMIACEYNIVPPNEPSRRFHDAFGFHEAGRQRSTDGAKQVSMQVATIDRVARRRSPPGSRALSGEPAPGRGGAESR